MARPKKKVDIDIKVVEEAHQEAVIEAVKENRRDVLQERIDYLRDLRDTLTNEGIDSIGKLDVIIGQVIQEQSKL